MSKVYTANEMRETAKLYYARAKTTMEVCSRRGGSAMVTLFVSEGISDRKVASMLLQAADAIEHKEGKGGGVMITDKELLKGETECPLYGKAIEEKKNHHWCADCNIGTDGTAVCLFRKCEMEVNDVK